MSGLGPESTTTDDFNQVKFGEEFFIPPRQKA